MDRKQAAERLRTEMNKHGLQSWAVRLNQNADSHFLGLCSHRDKCIILSAHHVDIHPDPDVINTIFHEIAHALTPGHSHDDVWQSKAKEIGCDNTLPCSNLSLSPEIIDAIRSGATVEVTFDEHVIRTPKYNITRLQDKCEVCGKVAKSVSEQLIETPGDTSPNMKFITLECGHMVFRTIPKGTPFHTFQMGGDPDCKHEWNKNKCMTCGRNRPYDFQLSGMAFLEAGLSVNSGAACFDEMGLGKTIQAGGVVYFHKEWWPVLWIVKSALKYQTNSFILNWMNSKDKYEHIPQIVNTSKDWLVPGLKHYIIGYDMLVPKTRTMKSGKVVNSGFDITQFDRVGIKCVILDECQQIKNVDSTRTQMVRKVVKGRKVIPLSGTPWNNRGSELFPVLNMMDPMKFNSEERFKHTWVDYYYQGRFMKEGGIRKIAQFKEYIKDLAIRRERKEVLAELPEVNRTKLNVVMTPQEEANYDVAVDEFVKWYEEQTENLGGMAIIAAMAKMRHLVALAKIPATLEYVDEFIEDTDRKLCVFAHHKDVQDILYHELKAKYDVPGEDRIPVLQFIAGGDVNETQATFNRLPRVILVASQLAAGEGLNLQTCQDCVMHERQWNPGKEEQCEGRFIRIGSVAVGGYVSAVYAHLEGLTTTDPKLDGIIERKRLQFHSLHNKGEGVRWSEDAIMKELAESIVRAHRAKKGKAA
jgi:hypothetical protein